MKRVGRLFREHLVSTVKEGLEKRHHVFMVSYSRVSGPQMNTLRKGLKSVGAHFYISRNSLAELALRSLKQEQLSSKISGQTAFVFSDADSIEVSKVLMKFTKECDGLVIQGGLLEGGLLEKSDVERLSQLPSRTILLTMLLRTLNTPLIRFAQALNAKTRDLLSILKQISEQKAVIKK